MRRKPVKQQQSREVVRVALGTLESNSHWNLVGRILLMVFALGTATAATVLVVFRADETVGVLTDPSRNDEIGKQLLALSAPVLLLLALAGLAVLVGFLVHSRGLDESVKTLDSVNRLRREDEVAVSARGLIVAFEDQLASIKRSHGVILWVARSLFIVTIGLFLACVGAALANGIDATTAVLGATSLAGALLGAATGVPTTISHEAANVLQMQLIVTGAQRQISMLESVAFTSLNDTKATRDEANAVAFSAQQKIQDVLDKAVQQVEAFADPGPEADVLPLRGRPAAA